MPVLYPEGEERRQLPRQRIEGVELLAPNRGVVYDLSPLGVSIEMNDCLAVGRDYALTIGEPGRNVRIECRVVWCRLQRTEKTGAGEVRPVFRLGARFLRFEERDLSYSPKPKALDGSDG